MQKCAFHKVGSFMNTYFVENKSEAYRAATISTISRIAHCHHRGDNDDEDDDDARLPDFADDCATDGCDDDNDDDDDDPPVKADEWIRCSTQSRAFATCASVDWRNVPCCNALSSAVMDSATGEP